MTEILQDYEQASPSRPQFLTIICILTFIGSGLGIISGSVQIATSEKQANQIIITKKKAAADIQKKGDNNAGTRFAEKMVNSMSTTFTAENFRKTGIAAIIGALFCIGGALLMWQLKRIGFYSYILGVLIGIVSPFIIYGNDNLMAIITSIGVGFIGIVFIILYGVNVKHMR
ncbi:hypothetical protein BH11BAC3_BH11BAC3_19230 [soil metagenome]